MTVYLLMRSWVHEGADCVGVFSTREKAEALMAEVSECYWSADHEVVEFTVDDMGESCLGHVHELSESPRANGDRATALS